MIGALVEALHCIAEPGMKKEEAVANGDGKDREDSGELSDYPLSRAKRARRGKKEEEGDWIPPKKPGRGKPLLKLPNGC